MEPVLPALKARASPALADHLLEEILVRIGNPADLFRASIACKAFRRLTADPTFLRRYRSLHPPLLLGFVDPECARAFVPADAPHPNASAARGFAAAADFSYDHILHSGRDGWARRYDARDGRVLLMCSDFNAGLVSPELAVFDALTRGYMVLPPIPEDLLASIRVQVHDEHVNFFDAFFDPSWGNEDEQFRVMCWMCCFSMAAVFVYSSVSRSWNGTSISYAALGLNVEDGNMITCQRNYAYGCVYWGIGIIGIGIRMIKFDINSMESAILSLPAGHESPDIMFVEAGEGRIGMFRLNNPRTLRYLLKKRCTLHYSIRQNVSENANERPVETTISLPCEYDCFCIDTAAKGYVFLRGLCKYPVVKSAIFSIEIKTLKLVEVCSSSVPSPSYITSL